MNWSWHGCSECSILCRYCGELKLARVLRVFNTVQVLCRWNKVEYECIVCYCTVDIQRWTRNVSPWFSSPKGQFPYNRFCRKDRLCRFKFLEATETAIWKCSFQTTEVIFAIETILAYGSSEIELESILDDPYARIVSIARIASVVWEEHFHIIVSVASIASVASKNLKQQRQSLWQKRLYGNQA